MNAQTAPAADIDFEREHDEYLEVERLMRNPLAYAASLNNDILMFHQAMKAEDSQSFVDAMIKEINGHVDSKIVFVITVTLWLLLDDRRGWISVDIIIFDAVVILIQIILIAVIIIIIIIVVHHHHHHHRC